MILLSCTLYYAHSEHKYAWSAQYIPIFAHSFAYMRVHATYCTYPAMVSLWFHSSLFFAHIFLHERCVIPVDPLTWNNSNLKDLNYYWNFSHQRECGTLWMIFDSIVATLSIITLWNTCVIYGHGSLTNCTNSHATCSIDVSWRVNCKCSNRHHYSSIYQ